MFRKNWILIGDTFINLKQVTKIIINKNVATEGKMLYKSFLQLYFNNKLYHSASTETESRAKHIELSRKLDKLKKRMTKRSVIVVDMTNHS